MSAKQKILWAGFIVTFIAAMAALPKVGFLPMIVPWGIFAWAMLDFFGLTPGTLAVKRDGTVADAKVLDAERTHTQMATGQAAYDAPFIWKYELEVHLPDQSPYNVTLRSTERMAVGATVQVKVGHRNHRNVVLV